MDYDTSRTWPAPRYRGKYADEGIISTQHFEDQNQYDCPAFMGWLAERVQAFPPKHGVMCSRERALQGHARWVRSLWGKAINRGIVLG